MRILLTGPTGQVGSALVDTLPTLGELIALDRSQLDLTSESSIRAAVRDVQPQVIVNAAAYTAVDKAESDQAMAFRVNRDGSALLAEEAARLNALLVHFSTDYVFDGEKASPYVETDVPNPLNAYGRSKLAGEQAIQASGCRHLIFRTSWIYAAEGTNFLLTMLRLGRESEELRVVNDQRGAPTSANMLAHATATAISSALADPARLGVYHMSAAGETTWYGFATTIFQDCKIEVSVVPIASAQYPRPARRPQNSLLDNSRLAQDLGIRLPHWHDGLGKVLHQLHRRGLWDNCAP